MNSESIPAPRSPRYAIYFVPPPTSALYRLGTELLGYDAHDGKAIAQPDDLLDAIKDWTELTEEPRTYGFHATLKAPFVLSSSKSEDELAATARDFAAAPRPLPRINLKLATPGRFIALVPGAPNAALSQLADDCVTAFDGFRAPLSPQDRARRLAAPLTDNQISHLDRWGYPYVFDEFRFHMTLTGSLPAERRAQILEMLRERLSAIDLSDTSIGSISILRQASRDARFVVIASHTLAAA